MATQLCGPASVSGGRSQRNGTDQTGDSPPDSQRGEEGGRLLP